MPKADMLMKLLKSNNKGFNTVLQQVKIISASDGNCQATFKVSPDSVNMFGTLHGGISATLVDVISSLALKSHPLGDRKSVSTDIHMTYLKSAAIGEEILINVKPLKVGKQIAQLYVEILNNANKDLLVKGMHTKFLMADK